MSSLDRILPFLRPIEDLLRDPTVTEVMVNDGGGRVFVERNGTLHALPGRTLERRNLTVAIKNIARACGDEISEAQPILDARLEDGSRVAAMFPPCAVAGPALTIRKFTRRYSLDDLVAVGTLTRVPRRTALGVPSDVNRTSSFPEAPEPGRRRLLNALAARIPDEDPDRPHRGDRRDSPDEAESPAVRGASRPDPARPGATTPGRDHRRPGPRDPAPSTGPHHRRRGPRPRGVRPVAGPQHGPPGKPQHHPRELGPAGAVAARALRADRQCRTAARQHARGDCPRHQHDRACRAGRRFQAGHRGGSGQGVRRRTRSVCL